MGKPRIIALSIALILAADASQYVRASGRDGCKAYVPAPGLLVAHAGGGLPDRIYANNLRALDLAARHGFTLVELDFTQQDGRLVIGHDSLSESPLTVEQLMAWLDAHPRISVITDMKIDNVSGLAMLKKTAGARLGRFIPQIYRPGEFGPVEALGYPAPILTIYRLGDEGWEAEANALPLRAVTMPVERMYLAKRVRHPVFLHTVDKPMPGFGLYTNCLVPERSGRTV